MGKNIVDELEARIKAFGLRITDTWQIKSFYGLSTYYTFEIKGKAYCISVCEYKKIGNKPSFVFSREDQMFLDYLYNGFNLNKCIKELEKEINKNYD